MTSTPTFSLVIPCYNEAKGLPELIRRARFVADEGGGEVILVDNGSADESAAVLFGELGPELVPGSVWWVKVEVNQGYGFGIRAGLASSRADFIGWTHADLQTDPLDVLRALDYLPDHPRGDLFVKGVRLGRPLADRVFTAGMSIFETLLLRRVLTDINAQPTMFSRSLMERWGEAPSDFSLDVFALYAARRLSFRVLRFPVIFADRKFGSSSWNTDFAAKWKFIKRTMDFSLEMKKRN